MCHFACDEGQLRRKEYNWIQNLKNNNNESPGGKKAKKKKGRGDYLAHRGTQEALKDQNNAPSKHNHFKRVPFLPCSGCRLLFHLISVTINTSVFSLLSWMWLTVIQLDISPDAFLFLPSFFVICIKNKIHKRLALLTIQSQPLFQTKPPL